MLWRFPFLDLLSVFNKNCGLRSVSVFMVPDVNHAHIKLWELENGSVSYHNWYRVYRIVPNRLLLYQGKSDIMRITAGSAAVNGLHYTGRSRTFVPRQLPRANAVWLSTILEGIVKAAGREEEGDCNLILASLWHKVTKYWVLATSDRWHRTPSTSRKWWQQSQLSPILTFLRFNQTWACWLVCR